MKKILILIIGTLLFCFMLTGCAGGTTETTDSTKKPENTTASDHSTPDDSTNQTGGIDSSGMDTTPPPANTDDTTGATPVAPGGSVSTTLPLYARLDFGTKTHAENQKMTTHEYIVGAMTYNSDFLSVEFTEDSMKITAKKDGTFSAKGETATTDDSRYFKRGTNTCYYNLNDFAINFDDLVSYDFEEELRSGYGTWANFPFTFGSVGGEDAWRGYHQYMKIRILNPTDNDKIAVQFNNASAYASTQFMVMSIGKQRTAYDSYIYDLCYAANYASGKGVLLSGQNPGNNWTWKQNATVVGLRFHLLGATCSYANTYLNNVFDEGESAATYDVYAEYFNRLDSRHLIKEGNSVEIDYIVFGSTPGQLEGYHSYIESSSLAAL